MSSLTKTAVQAYITATLPDNNAGLITPAVLRAALDLMVDSYAQGEITSQIITAAGAVTVGPTDGMILLNKAAPSSTALSLPDVTTRQDLLPLTIVDFLGTAGDMVLTANAPQLIMGLPTWTVGSGGVSGSGGTITLVNVNAVNGWIIL